MRLVIPVLSVAVLCLALWVTTIRLGDAEDALDHQEKAQAAQAAAIKRNQDTVTELCRTNGILRGVIEEWVELLRITEGRARSGIPSDQLGRYRLGRQVLQGFLEQLDQQTACREVIRP